MSSSGPPPPPGTSAAPSDAKDAQPAASTSTAPAGAASTDVEMATEPELPDDLINASTEDILTRTRLIENDIKVR